MNAPALPVNEIWSLRHAWHSKSDLAALSLCREELRGVGISLIDALPGEACDAVKMHGMDIADARNARPGMLHDMQAVASKAKWSQSLPGFVCEHMKAGESWYGIPLGIHQSNLVWVNRALVEKVGTPAPNGIPELLSWLVRAQRYVPAPLAIGAEPWQVGVMFEAVVLATAGKAVYRQAFVELDASVWCDPAMLLALDQLMALRNFVDDAALGQNWTSHLLRVQRGEAAMQFMGDWARLADTELVEWPAPGTANCFVAIADYFVLMASTSKPLAECVALKLTDPGFQSRFAMRKGCIPAVKMGPTWLGRQLPAGEQLLPSVALEQCGPTRLRRAMLETVAGHFSDRSSAATCSLALAKANR